MFFDLAKTASIMLTLGLLHGVFESLEFNNQYFKKIILGLLFGIICILGMNVPVFLETGVFFDARSVMISLGSAFGGPLVAFISSAIAGVYRLYIGGGGAVVGILVIISSSLCGLCFSYYLKKNVIKINWTSLILLGLIVHINVSFLFQFLPESSLKAVNEHIIPAMFLSFVPATVVLGLLMDIFSQRKAEHQTLVRVEGERQLALKNIIRALSAALEVRDPYTAGHSNNVARLSVLIGQKLGFDENQLTGLELGALIHDIGKFKVPKSVLIKPDKLTDDEFNLIKSHAATGGAILDDIDFDWPIHEIVAQHHERIDGSGYPLGLKGEQITLEARIVAVADTFDAMALDRPYRKAKGHQAALDVIREGKGKIYDIDVVNAFFDLIEEGKIKL